jgi:hypothetical protein
MDGFLGREPIASWRLAGAASASELNGLWPSQTWTAVFQPLTQSPGQFCLAFKSKICIFMHGLYMIEPPSQALNQDIDMAHVKFTLRIHPPRLGVVLDLCAALPPTIKRPALTHVRENA